MTEAIHFDSVTFAYRQRPILDKVSFTINSGDFVGIIGPNGSGKTTLLKVMMGFLEPQGGKVQVLGQSPLATQQRIAYVPQALSFDRQFPISVQELVLSGRLTKTSFLGRYRKEDRQKSAEAITKVGLDKQKSQAFGTLSSGERQRALLARALISDPQILLLDEPCANVDVEAQETIYAILEELKSRMTIIMVTHDLRVASEKVDSILCVEQTVFAMKPEEVCEHFAIGLYHGPLSLEKKP
jgi:zinc transport system ATP-binding protein